MQTESITALEIFERGLTKTELKSMATNAVDAVLEQGNPLQVAEALSSMETFIKEVKDDKRFTDYVREECAKTPKCFVSASGAKIELAETGTAYDFSLCGDQELLDLEVAANNAADLLKKRKEFLKTVPLSGLDIITADGVVAKVYPPSKTSKSSFKVTLSK